MHELSITQSMVELCEQYADGQQVISVTVEIGDLSGVVPQAVEFCFEACCRGTLLEGARLIITTIPGTARCRDCGFEQQVGSLYKACSACGGFDLELLSGRELRVRELEVD
jgi:hydrogenase nickel incorporation protein HypA/HybF